MKQLFNKLPGPWNIVAMAGSVVIIAILAVILTRINKKVFKQIRKARPGIHIAFFERINTAVIIIGCFVLAVSMVSGIDSIWRTVFGGTAIVSAVLAFAAQDVIKDILAGLMISLHKPFEIGDRIVLEDGTSGIVENITMRHVVIKGVDTLRLIIPNSKLNAMYLTNFSEGDFDRSIHFNFSVSYDTDLSLAKRVIFDAVKQSEYSIPVAKKEGDSVAYSPVYFLRFADSALILAVTVYYEKCFPTEVVMNDINTRVREALVANGIEIPYNYVTVVGKDGGKLEKEEE